MSVPLLPVGAGENWDHLVKSAGHSDNSCWESMESASECDNRQGKKEVHLVLVKVLCQQLYSRVGHNWCNLVPDCTCGCDMAVQELNEELTVLHNIKLVKAMLQEAGGYTSVGNSEECQHLCPVLVPCMSCGAMSLTCLCLPMYHLTPDTPLPHTLTPARPPTTCAPPNTCKSPGSPPFYTAPSQ